MNNFVANINVINFDLLNVASVNSEIAYKKGVQMTANGNDGQEHIFHPIFCRSIDEAAILIKEYTNIKAESGSFGNDLILHEVLIKILGLK